MSQHLYLIIAFIGCVSTIPFDQQFVLWNQKDSDYIPGVIPLEGLPGNDSNLNDNRNIYHLNPFHSDLKKNRSHVHDLVQKFENGNPSLGNLEQAPDTVDFAPKLLTFSDLQSSDDVNVNANNQLPRLHFGDLIIKNQEDHQKIVDHLPGLHTDGMSFENEPEDKNVDNRHLPSFHDSKSKENHNINDNHEIMSSENDTADKIIDNHGENLHHIEKTSTEANNHFLRTHGTSSETKSDYQHIGNALETPQGSEQKTSNLRNHNHIKIESKNNVITVLQNSNNKNIESSDHKKSHKFNFELKSKHQNNSKENEVVNCPNAKKKNHITEIFGGNISSLPLDDLKGRFDPESTKSSKIYVGEDVTVCWTEITTIKENKLTVSPNRQVIREYAISFENSATIPDEYLECSKMEGEISDDKRICDQKFPSTIYQDTRKSRVINTTMKTREGDLDVTRIKLIKCGVGSLVTREVFKTGSNDSKRIEIKVSPLTKKTDCKEHEKKNTISMNSCSGDICSVDPEDDDKLSTDTLEIVSSTPVVEELLKTDPSISVLETIEPSKSSFIKILETSSTKPSTLLETKSSEKKSSYLPTTTPDNDYSDSEDCSEETTEDGIITEEPNDDHARINKADFDVVPIHHATEPTTLDVERKLHELTTTSETRKSTLPINSSTTEKHQLALKIKISLEEIDNEKPRKIADIEKNVTLEEPLSDHGNRTLMQQLDAFNRSGDSLEAIKGIFNCSLLDSFSQDITSSEKKKYQKESEQDFDKLLDNVSEVIDHKGKIKRSVEGIEKLGSWSNERFMKLRSGKRLHSVTEVSLFRNFEE